MQDTDMQRTVAAALADAGLNPDEVRVEDAGHGSLVVYIEGLTLSEDGTIVPALREYRVTGTVRLRGTISVTARSLEEAHRIAFDYALAEDADLLVEAPTIESVEEVRV